MKNDILILSFWQLIKINYYAKKYNIDYFKKNITKDELGDKINHELFLNKQGFLIDLMFFNSFFNKKQEQWLINNINYNIINIKFVDFLNYSSKDNLLSKELITSYLIDKIQRNDLETYNSYFPHIINYVYLNNISETKSKIKSELLMKNEIFLLNMVYQKDNLIEHLLKNYQNTLHLDLLNELNIINEKNNLNKLIMNNEIIKKDKKFKI